MTTVDEAGAQSVYAEGLVVVRRAPKAKDTVKRGKRRPAPGWTLHVEGCFFLERVAKVTVMPAPAQPYPNTVSCQYCKPGEPHRLAGRTEVDGECVHRCACGAVGSGPTYNAARGALRRRHAAMERAAEREAGAQ